MIEYYFGAAKKDVISNKTRENDNIFPTKQLRCNTKNFIVLSAFCACLPKRQVQPIPVYAIVYRYSIIHPSGVFDRLYPNERSSPAHPLRATYAPLFFLRNVCRTHGN